MIKISAISAQTAIVTNVIKFVDCCTGIEIFFRGSLPVLDGSVYSYIGASPFPGTGGDLLTNGCYTVFNIYIEVVTYPPAPTMAVLSNVSKLGCNDPVCLPCTQPSPCDCPEGYVQSGDLCIKEVVTSATYSGQLFELEAGSKNQYYCDSGLRLYPDITSMTWPILGTGPSNAAYQLNQNNGAGPIVIPTANVLSQVWGKGTAPCDTGTTGGRLNIAGVGIPAYPANQELSFEFCITIDGAKSKQYMLGIAGDNYVKFYIDGNLAVFLNSPSGSVTTPFRHWHTFPITLTPGTHTIKLAGLNSLAGSAFAFAAEIYDTTLSNFQANLMAPAVSALNCGTSPATLEPYIIFSTRDLVGQQVANPAFPGVWSCPPGATLDVCSGVPTCISIEELEVVCACYMLIPCDGTEPFVTNNQEFDPFINTFISVDSEVYTGTVYVALLTDNTCSESIKVDITEVPVDECPLTCYYIQQSNGVLYVDANDDLQEITRIDAQPFVKICSKVYPVVDTSSVNYIIVDLGLCDINGCPIQCYKLVNCDDKNNVIYTNSDSVLPYLYGTNQIVQVAGQQGCWEVSLSNGNCDCLIVDVTSLNPSFFIPFTATANAIGTYNGNTLYSFVNDGTTYYIWKNEKDQWVFTADGYGDDNPGDTVIAITIPTLEICPKSSDGLIDWRSALEGVSTTTSKCPSECECPIDIIINSSYSSCEACIGYIAYRLTSCTNNDVIYTLLNLEEYIGQVVKIDCGCYTVQQINYLPANPQLIKLEDVYTNCLECNRTYWKLIDCLEEATPIITYTDLGGYVGKTVKIKGCDECWTVEATTEHIGATAVLVTEEHLDCEDCGSNLPCICSNITNYSEEVKTYTYLSCDREYETITLQPHETSDRICVLKWVPNRNCCLESTFTFGRGEIIEEYNWQFEATDEVINGKPVYITYINYVDDYSKYTAYKLFYQPDGCWYAVGVSTGTFEDYIPVYKLCTTSDCPIGVWERFDCGVVCFRIKNCPTPKCVTISVSFVFAYYDQNNNPVYLASPNYSIGEQYQLSYNVSLSRWEIIDLINNDEVIAYKESDSSACPNDGVVVKEWTSPSDNVSVSPTTCKIDRIDTTFETRGCGENCDCINMNLYTIDDPIFQFILEPTGGVFNGKPTYQAYTREGEMYVYFDSTDNKWYAYFFDYDLVFLEIPFNSEYPNCPIGDWIAIEPFTPDNLPIYQKELNADKAAAPINVNPFSSAKTEYCTTGTSSQIEDPNDDPFAYIQFFGECQHGVCPPPVFKNNRTVRPGYNTPICRPEKYDMITCHFADILYRIALEKRYGITNCCPEEDDKWLVQKELIDLQALKDPNYVCPDCPCSCNSGKTHSTCNCGI